MAIGRGKRLLLGVGITALLLGGALVVVPPILFSDGVDYSQVSSIKSGREYQDAALLAKAWALPVAERYQGGLDFQGNGSFCGPTSVVNVLRSLGAPADQATLLEDTGVSTLFGVLPGGVTLDQLADVARKKVGRPVTVLRDLDLEEFRAQLRRVNDPAVRYLINFHRGPLFGAGGGHHSPLAGYLEQEDLVLVLDVNESFGPWLVSSERLFTAMDTVDTSVDKKRGLLLIE